MESESDDEKRTKLLREGNVTKLSSKLIGKPGAQHSFLLRAYLPGRRSFSRRCTMSLTSCCVKEKASRCTGFSPTARYAGLFDPRCNISSTMVPSRKWMRSYPTGPGPQPHPS